MNKLTRERITPSPGNHPFRPAREISTLQTPDLASGLQLYGTTGGGLYREQLGSFQSTHVVSNLGGSIKKTLTDPLQLRLDYCVFNFMGDSLHSRPQRFYAGLNVKF